MAMVYIMATVQPMPPLIHRRDRPQEKEFEALLLDLFRRAGWSIYDKPPADGQGDVIVESGGKKYVIEAQRSAEGPRTCSKPMDAQDTACPTLPS